MDTHTLTIALHGVHGVTVSTADMDRAIATYLPASPYQLRQIVQDRTGARYDDVVDVSAFLVILADFDRTDGQ